MTRTVSIMTRIACRRGRLPLSERFSTFRVESNLPLFRWQITGSRMRRRTRLGPARCSTSLGDSGSDKFLAFSLLIKRILSRYRAEMKAGFPCSPARAVRYFEVLVIFFHLICLLCSAAAVHAVEGPRESYPSVAALRSGNLGEPWCVGNLSSCITTLACK